MGMDFMYACFPQFEFAGSRKEHFRQTLAEMTDAEQEELRDYYYFEDESLSEIVDDMLKTIEEASCWLSDKDYGKTRQAGSIVTYDENGKKMIVAITGGMSWGDPPTEAYDVLDKAQHLTRVYALACKCSGEDNK